MALSWNELSVDHKIVLLLESLSNEESQQAPIACRFRDEILFDNNSLLDHFQFHFHQDGAFNGRPLVGSSVPGNSSNSISQSLEYTHSLLAPFNIRDSVAHENTGPSAWQNVSPNTPNLYLGNSRVPSFSHAVQLRGSTLTDRTFASGPNRSSNFNSRFASQSTGSLNLCSAPIRLAGADIFTLKTTEQSTFSFLTYPGTSGHAFRTTRCLPQTARRNEVEGPSFGYTKLYINQLERPIRKTIVVHDDDDHVGGNNNPDQIDLALKL